MAGFEVLFVDYGNTDKSTDLRTLPEQLLNTRPTAIHCALQSSVGLQQPDDPSPFTEFVQNYTGDCCYFQLIDTTSMPSIVRMFADAESVHEILAASSSSGDGAHENASIETTNTDKLEEAPAATVEPAAAKEIPAAATEEPAAATEEPAAEHVEPVADAAVPKEPVVTNATTIAGTVCLINSSADFFLQPLTRSDDLATITNELCTETLAPLPTPPLDDRQLCAAYFADDEQFYRAKMRNADGAEVYLIDFGNEVTSTDLRVLPEALHHFEPCAMRCSLATPTTESDVVRLSETEFENVVYALKCCYAVIVEEERPSKDSTVVRLFRDAECLDEIKVAEAAAAAVVTTTSETTKPSATDEEMQLGEVCWSLSSVDFYVQMADQRDALNDVAERLENAATFPTMTDPTVGSICAAHFDGAYYRAKVLRQVADGGGFFVVVFSQLEMFYLIYFPFRIRTTLPRLWKHFGRDGYAHNRR